MRKWQPRRTHVLLRVILLILLFANLAFPAAAHSNDAGLPSFLRIREMVDGVSLEWSAATEDAAVTATALQSLPSMRFQGYELPMQLVTLKLGGPASAASLQVDQVKSIDWQGALQPAAPLQPPVLAGGELTELAPQETVALPVSPVFILRQGRIYGQSTAIVAISPLYQANGVIKFATGFKAKIANATTVPSDPVTLLKTLAAQSANAAGVAPMTTEALAPVNRAAAADAVKLIVHKPGLQSVSGQTLADAGLKVNDVDLTQLHLYWQGTELPLEIIQSPAFELRFYAGTVGDRWNGSDTYWLTVEPNNPNNGLRMAVRVVEPGSAPPTQTAIEKGVWEHNLVYQSKQPGPDGDHWFNKVMEVSPSLLGNPARYPTATVPINNVLPSAAGTSLVTVTLTAYFQAQYTLAVDIDGAVHDLTWNNAPNGVLIRDWALPFSTTANLSQLRLTLVPDKDAAALNLDRIFWQRPVLLDFQGRGARFMGLAGLWLYRWRNIPTPHGHVQLYDVTNPLAPVMLTGANELGFQDGPDVHEYLLAGPGVIQTPQAIAHKGQNLFGVATGADALYIAPAAWMDALEPLRAHRSAQGYLVQLIDVQDIYDAWSYGQVSPDAIRTFLRYAQTNWQPAPISVVLVGDASWDPHNYQGFNNPNFIPAYMADVDPWLGETACENCYVQLDGDDPVTGDGQLFKPEMWIGRFPVKTAEELNGVVVKLIHYETAADLGTWRGTTVLLADNYVKELDANGNPIFEGPGDFAQMSDENLQFFPAKAQVRRVYYDPYPAISDPQGLEGWRIAESHQAWTKVLSELGSGAGIVAYNGHGNHWQWAITDQTATPNFLLGLYDTDRFLNYNSLFISLSMTCFTAQFAKPAHSGTTLDERIFLNPRGGAVAVWGSAGMSVARGHLPLQQGFYRALWAAEPMQARLGELLEAGYTELLTKHTCCQDALQTFLLVGDPLTPARVQIVDPPVDVPTLDSAYFPLIFGRK